MPWPLFASSFTQKVGLYCISKKKLTDGTQVSLMLLSVSLSACLLISCTRLIGFRFAEEKGCILQMGSIARDKQTIFSIFRTRWRYRRGAFRTLQGSAVRGEANPLYKFRGDIECLGVVYGRRRRAFLSSHSR